MFRILTQAVGSLRPPLAWASKMAGPPGLNLYHGESFLRPLQTSAAVIMGKQNGRSSRPQEDAIGAPIFLAGALVGSAVSWIEDADLASV